MQNVLTGKEVQENGFSKMCIKFSERKYRHFPFRHSDFLYFKSHLPLLPRSRLNQPITPSPTILMVDRGVACKQMEIRRSRYYRIAGYLVK